MTAAQGSAANPNRPSEPGRAVSGSVAPATPDGPGSRTRATTVWALALCALILAPTLAYRLGVDQGVFAYMGAELLDGRWPYIDTWESDFPGMVFLQAIEIALLGRSIVAFRLFDLLFQLANAYLIFRVARLLGARAGAILAAATYCLIYQGYGPWNTAQREGFGIFFILFGYWLLLSTMNRDGNGTEDRASAGAPGPSHPAMIGAAIGLGLGIAFTFKPTLLALAAFYLPLLLRPEEFAPPILPSDSQQPGSTNKAASDVRARRREPGVIGPRRWDRRTLAVLAATAAGVAAPTLVILLVYWIKGGLLDLYEACIAYQSVYTRLLTPDSPSWQIWPDRLRSLGGTTVVLLLVYPPFLFLAPARRARGMLYLGYLGSVVSVLAQGTFAGYHYIPGLAIGAVMIGTMFSTVSGAVLPDRLRWHDRAVTPAGNAVTDPGTNVLDRERPRQPRVNGPRHFPLDLVAALLIVLLALPVYVRPQPVRDLLSLHFLDRPRSGEFRNRSVFDFTEDWNVAEYLRERTGPEDRIQVWGYESLVYYLADRTAASRFQSSHALVMRVPGTELTPMQRGWRREFLRDVATNRPRYVAVVRDDDWWWSPGRRTSAQLLDDFPEWKAFVKDNYELESTIGRFSIYGLRAP